jgi:hypothetical protein
MLQLRTTFSVAMAVVQTDATTMVSFRLANLPMHVVLRTTRLKIRSFVAPSFTVGEHGRQSRDHLG